MSDQTWVQNFVKTERLPATYISVADDYLIPFAKHLAKPIKQFSSKGVPMVIGVNGAQGTGKTTFAKFLSSYLTEFFDLHGTHISLDDFYLTRSERKQLANDIHPLFMTRGVPGTHDTVLAASILNTLKTLKHGESLALPRFDKAIDDRTTQKDWPLVKGAQDFVIFEGWCVGSRSMPTAELENPINSLEENEDPQAIWRAAVNKFLSGEYRKLFSLIDVLVFLKAPDFAAVLQWRTEQEEKLAQEFQSDQSRIMHPEEIANFTQFFERITRQNLSDLPKIADFVFEFDHNHQIISHLDKHPLSLDQRF